MKCDLQHTNKNMKNSSTSPLAKTIKYSAKPVANPFDNPNGLTAQQIRQQNLEEAQRLKPVSYRCGNCENEITIRSRDGLHCNSCNGRVLYKKRTSKSEWEDIVGIHSFVLFGKYLNSNF